MIKRCNLGYGRGYVVLAVDSASERGQGAMRRTGWRAWTCQLRSRLGTSIWSETNSVEVEGTPAPVRTPGRLAARTNDARRPDRDFAARMQSFYRSVVSPCGFSGQPDVPMRQSASACRARLARDPALQEHILAIGPPDNQRQADGRGQHHGCDLREGLKQPASKCECPHRWSTHRDLARPPHMLLQSSSPGMLFKLRMW